MTRRHCLIQDCLYPYWCTTTAPLRKAPCTYIYKTPIRVWHISTSPQTTTTTSKSFYLYPPPSTYLLIFEMAPKPASTAGKALRPLPTPPQPYLYPPSSTYLLIFAMAPKPASTAGNDLSPHHHNLTFTLHPPRIRLSLQRHLNPRQLLGTTSPHTTTTLPLPSTLHLFAYLCNGT